MQYLLARCLAGQRAINKLSYFSLLNQFLRQGVKSGDTHGCGRSSNTERELLYRIRDWTTSKRWSNLNTGLTRFSFDLNEPLSNAIA